MAINTKIIKKRIGSVKNTKKITKAMEMVAAAKMRKAVSAATNTREYATMAQGLLKDLSSDLGASHPLTKKRKGNKHLYILITSNRGLCGSFNNSVLSKADKFINEKLQTIDKEKTTIDIIAIGLKGVNFAKRKGLGLIAVHDKISENPTFESTLIISNTILDMFRNNQYDEVGVIYTNFISGLNQIPVVRQILPVSAADIERMIQESGEDSDEIDYQEERFVDNEYTFEPTRERVLDYILPKLIEIQVYQSILESVASEHSSRRIAMKNASDSAQDMIEDLSLLFNKERQAAITQEISEIVSASEAIN